MPAETVSAWAEKITIPTYRIGAPDKNPMFLEKRVYQGSSGVVYPHPVIDRIFDEKSDAVYTAVFLENRYLKIMLLPEIGGRVQMALDKTNGYHFVYYNRVIKPALVGLAGPWISGGIEFNWPQHHRPSTFDPVNWRIDENADGSRTVWCSEIERMFNTKGMTGFTLYPDRALLEIRVQLYNRTSEPQTFLWWANPAVHVNDDYQSVFPPDVHAVMDHGKRDVSTFPIATGTYYKVDYGAMGGVDISRYKNIPVPTSYMAYHSDFDFMGDYDHGAQAGMLHVANHHFVPGKKQWTWGHSDFGKMWDRQLTDEDGPYIELMCGAFTDNQPDFSWIMPGEERAFTQVFMPYKKIGPASNASREVVLHMDCGCGPRDSGALADHCEIGVYVTSPRSITAQLLRGGDVLFEHAADLNPETGLIETVPLPEPCPPQQLSLRVLDDHGVELLSFTPLPDARPEIPAPAAPARDPQEIETNEELFLNGLHLEQYRHATYAPEPYYLEALRRDPLDARCNNAMGLLLYRRGRFAEAEAYFRAAVKRLTLRNPNPYDGEPYYNLGLALKMQGRFAEAADALYKSTWNVAWQAAAFFELARLACRAGRGGEAEELVERSLRANWSNHRARHLKIALLRRAGCIPDARQEITLALKLDRMEFGAMWESYLISGDPVFHKLAGGDAFSYTQIALDYTHTGLFEDALTLLRAAPQSDPLVLYYTGWVLLQMDSPEAAQAAFQNAAGLAPDYCFPNTLESVLALEAAIRANPQDARAPYYLGNFWYAHRQYEPAIAAWEEAARLDPEFSIPFRNLGLAYFNKLNDPERAWQAYETAHRLAPNDARVFFELDQLAKKRNLPVTERLERLERRQDLVEERDDLTVEYLNLLLVSGAHKQALEILAARSFHPWEGGEGKVAGAYVSALIESAREHLAGGRADRAVECLQAARSYPPNLGEGKLHGALENNILYYLGRAAAMTGDGAAAEQFYRQAREGMSEPTSAMFYNDQPPHMIFYQGLAMQALGEGEAARRVFERLVAWGEQHMHDTVRVDYFAVSLPDFLVFDEDLNRRNHIHCRYMMALGALGLGDAPSARALFDSVLEMQADHTGAHLHRRLLDE